MRPDRCTRVWLGATDFQEEGVWRDSETNEILNLNSFWGPGQPNGVRIQNCAGIWEFDGEGHNRYDDGGCVKERQCSLCKFSLLPRAMLRGICKNNYVDVFYTFTWDDETNMPYFKGFTGSNIKYNEDLESWLLTTKDNLVNGTSVAPIKQMGTGAQIWNFNKDICGTNTNRQFDAVMTVCKRDEFTCNSDGGCISMAERCDQFPNCDDFSDEANCRLVVLPENYVPDYAPFTVDDKGDLLKVKVLIKVRN